MIRVNDSIALPESELKFTFVQASGPGGQNVNKVATAVQLRFDALHSPSLPPGMRRRLLRLAGSRATAAGEIVIDARRQRSQAANRQDAIARLVALIRRAAAPPKTRRRTVRTRASHQRRMRQKSRRSTLKQQRRHRPADEV